MAAESHGRQNVGRFLQLVDKVAGEQTKLSEIVPHNGIGNKIILIPAGQVISCRCPVYQMRLRSIIIAERSTYIQIAEIILVSVLVQ